MTDPVVALNRITGAAQRIRNARGRAPLAMARLWHRDEPRTSQRTAFTQGIGDLVHFVVGGKGSGKTEGAIQVAAAMARGRRDPEVQAWARANGFPIHRIPPEPRLVLVSAASHQLSHAVLRPLFASYMPPGTHYDYWNAKQNEASARTPAGCLIRFMADSQPATQFESMAADFALLDEEHREVVFDNVQSRVVRRRWPGSTGWVLLSATPATAMRNPDMAWTIERFEVERREGYSRAEIHGSDNPFLDRHARELMLASMTAAKRAMEERGAHDTSGIMVLEAWDKRAHVVKPFAPPPEWMRLGALDIGTRAPTAYLGAAFDAQNDQLHIYTGHYHAHPDPAHHAIGITGAHAAFGERLPSLVLGDLNTPDAQEIAIKYRDQGIHLVAADKAFSAGVASTNGRMEVRPRGSSKAERPGLVIHDTPALQPLIREIPVYVWRNGRGGHDATQGADHACDALRYLCHHLWMTRRGR